jgi:hypothetical protein
MAALGNRHREALLLLSKGNTIVRLFSNTSNVRRGAREAGLTNFAIVRSGWKVRLWSRAPYDCIRICRRQRARARADQQHNRQRDARADRRWREQAGAPEGSKAKLVANAPAKAARKAQAPARGTRKAQLFAMITKGATTAEIADAFGWLPHTTRGALSRSCQQHDVQKTKLPSAAAIVFVVACARSTKLMEWNPLSIGEGPGAPRGFITGGSAPALLTVAWFAQAFW